MNLRQFFLFLADEKIVPQGMQRAQLAEIANNLVAARATISEKIVSGLLPS